jgi:undecaprenyl-diphosphatase
MRSAAVDSGTATVAGGVGTVELIIGFLAAFFTGLLACSWMINMVKKGKLIWFAVYCVVVGAIAIGIGLLK